MQLYIILYIFIHNLSSIDIISITFQSKIVLRNGTNTIGLTKKVEVELNKLLPEANIITKENASRQNYDQTLIIVINPEAQSLASSLTKQFNASASALPKGESQPKEGDIVIILGKDSV